MNFKPLNKRVLVKVDKEKKQTDAGIFLPESVQKDFATGVVFAVGDEAELVKVGQKIMFAHSVGVDIEVNGNPYRLIPDEGYIDAIV
jgi:chaperonin GroES